MIHRTTRLAILVAVGAILVWSTSIIASPQSGNVLLPDLAFHFVCHREDPPTLEKDIEKFLVSKGFRVLNRARLQREYDVLLFDTDIVGLDDKQRIVDIIRLPHTRGQYAVSLTSAPPTQHSPDLEAALLALAKETLACEVQRVSRNKNGPEAIFFYKDEVKRIEGLLREAEKLQGRGRI